MLFPNDTISSTGGNLLISVSEAMDYIRADENDTANSSLSAFISNAIGYVSDTIESYCNKGIKEQTYIGIYSGNNCNNKLLTDNYPIHSISSLQYRVSPLDTFQDLVPNLNTFVHNHNYYLRLYSYSFPFGEKNIKIIYNAGYPTIPNDIKQVALEMTQIIYSTSQYGNGLLGYKSQNENPGSLGTSKTIDFEPVRKEHRRILDKYKKFEI